MATLTNVFKPLADVVRLCQKAAIQAKWKVQINSGYRSSMTQAEIAKEGNQYPVAAPGKSQHQYGFAVDLQAVPWSNQSTLVRWMTYYGAYWGGTADPVHFSVFTPTQWAQMLGVSQSIANPTTPLSPRKAQGAGLLSDNLTGQLLTPSTESSAPLSGATLYNTTPEGLSYAFQPITIPEGQSPDYWTVETYQRLLAQNVITNPEVARQKLAQLLSSR